jgi:hypothetical protein
VSETITIDVSGAGAIATGTTRGSTGSAVLRESGWRWSRSLGVWCLPRRLRNETVDLKVYVTLGRLSAAGVEVTVVGEDDRETDEERAARLLASDRELIEVHEHKAAQARQVGDAEWEKGRRIADMIPLGQPILVGHHSEGRHRRDLGRIHRHSDRAADAWDEAKDRESRALSARQRVTTAETRDVPPRFGRDDIAVGDVVQWRGTWHPVVRVNAKTVTVPSIVGGLWTDRLPYDEITEVRRPGRASKPDGVRDPDQPGSETAS